MLISVSDFDNLAADLSKSECQSAILLAIKAAKKAVYYTGINSSTTVIQRFNVLAKKETFKPKQSSDEWYRQRVGKINSSKLLTLVGLSGNNEFHKA